MPRRKTPAIQHVLFDLFDATKPRFNEHRVAFSILFSDTETKRLTELKDSSYLTEALRTFRDLMKGDSGVNPAIDTVLIVERSRTKLEPPHEHQYRLHVHGWVLVKKTMTAECLTQRMKKKALKGDKLRRLKDNDNDPLFKAINFRDTFVDGNYEDLYPYEDEYIPPKATADTEPVRSDPINYGWVSYLTKDFNRTPSNCKPSRRKISASEDAKTRATSKRKKRSLKLHRLSLEFDKTIISEYANLRSLRYKKRLSQNSIQSL